MSDANKARRTNTQVVLAGVDLSVYVNCGYMSLTYTDNEEDEADDLQIKAHDRDRKWLTKWLNSLIDSAATGGEILDTLPVVTTAGSGSSSSSSSSGSASTGTAYKVTAATGVNVRSGAGEGYRVLGKLTYGTVVTVSEFYGSWAKIAYIGKNGFIKGANLKLASSAASVSSSSSTSSSSSAAAYSARAASVSSGLSGSSSSAEWAIGDDVIASGAPQYDSWGSGKPGKEVSEYSGKVTHLNLKAGVPYPIHVGYLGWFAEGQVQRASAAAATDEEKAAAATSAKGLKISAAIVLANGNGDGVDSILDCGQFELDSIVAQGPPATVTIKATSMSYANTIRQVAKSKSWECVTLKRIAGEIAKSNGMGLVYESGSNPEYQRVEQYCMTDIAFLQQLCRDAGASLKITNNIVVVYNQAEYESRPAVTTIKYGESGYTQYKLSTGTNDCYTSCRVYCTTASGTVISAIEYAADYDEDSTSGQCLQVRRSVSSKAEAQELAHKLLRLHNKYETTAVFTLPGSPALAAGCVVVLEGFGFGDGRYIISRAQHSVSSSGYTTQITLRQCLDDETTASSSTDVSSTAADDLDDIALQVIRGDWGNGTDRYNRLTAAGYDYSAVQALVNQKLYGS